MPRGQCPSAAVSLGSRLQRRLMQFAMQYLQPGEPIYIATDETAPDFFAPFERAGHTVFRWHDFFGPKGGSVLAGTHVHLRCRTRVLILCTLICRHAHPTKTHRLHRASALHPVVQRSLGRFDALGLLICAMQVIASGGRRFFGTRFSTFTSLIFRLRGYVRAPDTNLYWHNHRYTGIASMDKYTQPFLAGRSYFDEWPYLWHILEDGALG